MKTVSGQWMVYQGYRRVGSCVEIACE
jgi:hypothetical protein